MLAKSETAAGFGSWEEWRYRHEFFWATTTRWLVAVLAIAGLPYSSEQLRNSFGLLTIVFPIFACLIDAVAFAHLLAEHARALYVRWFVSYREKENEFIADAKLLSRAHQWLRRPIFWRIGPYIFCILALGLFGLTGLNLLLSRQFLEKELSASLSVWWTRSVNGFAYLWIALGIGAAIALVVGDFIS